MDGTELANTGEHPALNFLNTRLRPWGEQLDLLASGRSFLDWMVSAGLLDDGERRLVARRFAAAEVDATAVEARELREWLRGEIERWVDGGAISPATVKRINAGLAGDRQHVQLYDEGTGLALRPRREWTEATQLLAPVLASVAELLAEGDRELVRVCDGPRCALWFYDRTRSHRRRWCSQAVCGNRDKVRNHRARQHAVGER